MNPILNSDFILLFLLDFYQVIDSNLFYFRLGAIVAPQLALVLPTITPNLPTLHLYIFSIVSLLGSFLAIIVPDTVNSQLPEDFDQVFLSKFQAQK